MSAGQKPRRISWVYSVFPVSLATGPLATLVQLYLNHLEGITVGTLYFSLAAAIFNGVSIPAALFWGFATDRLQRRRALIATGYSLMGLILVSFYFEQSAVGTVVSYAAFSFVSVASAAPINLLIMETETKTRWASAFARLSMVSSIGNVAGLLLGTFWTNLLPHELALLFLPMGLFSVASAALSLATMTEPAFTFERNTLAMRRPSFFSRFLANPVFFLGVPTTSDFRRIFRGMRSTLTNFVPLFYLSTILFYLSSGLFNTSFVPSMQRASLSQRDVFAVILAGMAVQTLAFRGSRRFVSDRPLATTSIQGLLLRGWSYLAIGAAALFITGPLFLVPALVLYPLAAGVAFALYYTSSNTMMFNTVHGRNAGATIGVYSAVVGIAAMAGSLASGFISVYLGFYTTFLAAGVLLLLAVSLVTRMPSMPSPLDDQQP